VGFARIVFGFVTALSLTLIVIYKGNNYEVSSKFETQTIMDQFGYYRTNFSESDFDINVTKEEMALYNRFWAPDDYIRQVDDEVFEIFTNFGIANTTIRTCAEDPQYDNVICNKKDNFPCKQGKQSPNGIQTGKCVDIDIPQKHISNRTRWFTCEVEGWCPVAIWPPLKSEVGAVLLQTKNTSISIQNFIEFTDFGVKFKTENSAAPNCVYNQNENKHCSYFRLGDIIRFSSDNTKSFEEIATYTGGIFEIRINWKCEMEMECVPEFSFWRRDDENDKSPTLWSFWEFEKSDPNQRVLKYGMKIKFYVVTTGEISRKDRYKSFLQFTAYSTTFIIIMLVFGFFIKLLNDC
jgi:hypothetical protein